MVRRNAWNCILLGLVFAVILCRLILLSRSRFPFCIMYKSEATFVPDANNAARFAKINANRELIHTKWNYNNYNTKTSEVIKLVVKNYWTGISLFHHSVRDSKGISRTSTSQFASTGFIRESRQNVPKNWHSPFFRSLSTGKLETPSGGPGPMPQPQQWLRLCDCMTAKRTERWSDNRIHIVYFEQRNSYGTCIFGGGGAWRHCVGWPPWAIWFADSQSLY